jgi:O-antigen/teichoic acid export membrane protein
VPSTNALAPEGDLEGDAGSGSPPRRRACRGVKVSDSPLRRLFVQASHYSLANLLAGIAGLITFPLLTRIFSVADYGAMNLISATLTVAVAVGKLGVQHSIISYQSEMRAGKGPSTLQQFYSTTILGMLASGLCAMLVLATVTHVVPTRWLGDPRLRGLFAIASLIVLIQVLESGLINFVRADQLTSLLMKYQVAKKYLGISIILFAVFVISKTLTAFYTATLVTEMAGLAVFWSVLHRRSDWPRFATKEFRRPLYLQMLGFGVPMMIGYELSGIILGVGDRYLIHGLIGETALGLYAAAYNLCQYVQSVVLASVGQAVMPLYMQMWEQKGPEETSAFIARSLRTYVLVAAPVITGLASVGPQLLPMLASQRYAAAAGILPWVIAGMVVDGANSMVGAGLFIHRKTRRIMAITLTCAALNIGLNLVLLPRVGIIGSAFATLVSYLIASVAMAIAGRRLLPVKLPWATMARSGLAAMIMYASLIHIHPARQVLAVAVRILSGVLIYGVLIVSIDADARALLRRLSGHLRRGARNPQPL